VRPEGVFVYGTLKRGERAAALAERAGLVARVPALAKGLVLFDLPFGYPAAVPGEGVVYGELLYFEDLERALALLDRYEGSEYLRVPHRVLAGGRERLAWVYLYKSEEAARKVGGRRLRGGRWRGALSQKP